MAGRISTPSGIRLEGDDYGVRIGRVHTASGATRCPGASCAVIWVRGRVWLVTATLMLALAGCGGSSDDEQPPPPPPKVKPAVTQPGTPAGDPASASLTSAGGSLTSPDGRLTMTVPEGALGEPTTLSIQPITNGAPGSQGPAYRLLPQGQTFSKPVTLTFHYTDDDVAGSAPQLLGIATHLPDGTWQAIGGPQVDETAHTVSISTSHFSDWSTFRGLKLFPTSGAVMVNKTKQLTIRYCTAAGGYYGITPAGETGYLYNCDEVVDPTKPEEPDEIIPLTIEGDPTYKVLRWAVNGVDGGNSTVGRISAQGVYTAPASVPGSNPVAVSVTMQNPYGPKILQLVSSIKVVDEARGYSGSVSGTIRTSDSETEIISTFTASNIRLGRVEALPGDLMQYRLAQGTVESTTTMRFLTEIPVRVVTFHLTGNSQDSAELQVFDPVRPQGPDFAGKFFLHIATHGDPEIGADLGPLANHCAVGIGAQGASAFMSYGDDPSVLEGSFNRTCPIGGGLPPHEVSMQWSLQIDENVE